MKRYIKSIITLTALLFLGTGAASAQSSSQEEEEKAVKVTKVIQLDGEAKDETAAGKLEITLSEPDDKMDITMTIKATPANGNYITEDFIYLTKTVDGNMAQTRDPNIDTEKIEVTPSEDNGDPSEATTYTYKISPAKVITEQSRDASTRGWAGNEQTSYFYYDYEVNANFQSRIDISKAVVTVSGTYEETGEEQEIDAENVTVTLNGETVDPKYYTYECKDTEKAGDATITVTGIGIYTGTATGTFKINGKDGYPLWVNGIQVTRSNWQDVLGNDKNPEIPRYIFNSEKKQLLIDHDQTGTTVIESRMDKLYIYLMDVSKIDHIFFNNNGDTSNKGTLTFTTNGNFPGKLVLTNSTKGESAITGFSEIEYNWNLVALEPDGSYYDTDLMMKYKEKDEDGKETGNILVADNITIGQAIVPITEKKTIRFEESQLVEKDEDGNVKFDENGDPIPADLSNYPYAPSTKSGEPEKNVVLINLNPENISDLAGGFGTEDGFSGIYIGDTMTDAQAGKVANDVDNQNMVPGGSTYAENYDGFTFMLPAGYGIVDIDDIVEDGYEFHLIIGTDDPITLDESNSRISRQDDGQRVQSEIHFNVTEPVYCYLYLVKKGAGTRGIGGTRLGKREKAHGKLISLSVSVTRSIPTDPPSDASGDLLDEDDDPEVETGITNVRYEQAVGGDKWYNLKGQQIETPTQKGIYIQNRKKIIIK